MVLRFRFFIISWLWPITAFCQPEPVMVNDVAPAVNIGYHCQLFKDTAKIPRLSTFFSEDQKPLHNPYYTGNNLYIYDKNLEGGFWVYFEAINNTLDTVTDYFYFGQFLESRLFTYEVISSRKSEIDLKGIFLTNNDFAFPVTFLPQTHYRVCVYLSGLNSALVKPIFFIAGTSSYHISNLVSDQNGFTQYERLFVSNASLMLQGFLLSMLSFSIVYFILTRKKVFGWYFLYILTTFLYFFHRHYDFTSIGLFWHQVAFLRDSSWQPLSYMMYFLFAVHFVSFDQLSRPLHKLMKSMIVLLALYLLADLTLHFTQQFEMRSTFYNYFRYLMGVPALVCIFWTLSLNDRLAKILATGSLFMVGGALITMVVSLSFNRTGNPWLDYHMIYMYIGIAIETMFFAIGLGYKNRLSDQAKIKAESDLQLEKERANTEKLRTILETQNQERERVAMELHDDLGSGLASIKMLSEAAKTQSDNKNILNRISLLSTETADSLRQIVWSMNPANYNLLELIRYLKNYSSEFCEIHKLSFEFRSDVNEINIKMKPVQIRNIVLVVKETLNNISKHAHATLVLIHISEHHGLLKFQISDNGKGLNSMNIGFSGNGLRSMKKRMEQVNGKFELKSENGTTVFMEIPL